MLPLNSSESSSGLLESVAPANLGNEECPGAVIVESVVPQYVPVVFTTAGYSSDHQSVVIDENTDVNISFNFTDDGSACPALIVDH
ncbi:hypothetical protein Tsubulata_019749 [Turnera subulata]|uniref:Uncharacterized protein n=1 Tax=Turnera subulata TaxID=218843 RepID=A0A9Q0FUI6_9ROSI|nr:hypothetical protein Tsubulata_019749 [Turnera subulata]